MTSAVTAKVKIASTSVNTYQAYNSVTDKTEEVKQARVQFYADYMDGVNKAWAAATPTLNLDMTVNGEVADFFEQGGKYTLTFARNED